MRRATALAVGVAIALSSATSRAEDERLIALYGVGADTCGALLQAWSEGLPSVGVEHKGRIFSAKSNLYMQWVSGFVSAYNSLNPAGTNLAGAADIEGLFAWIRKYCEEHPLHLVNRAATALIESESKLPKVE